MKTSLISLFVIILCSAIIFIGTTELHPQTRRGMKISVRTNAGEHIELYNASYALVIGNGNYTNGWDPLPGAMQDVKEVAETLKTHGFNVTLKTDLTTDEFNEAFRTFVLEHGADENNRLLFYYAGHGYTLPLANEQERGYLVMVDAPDPDTDKLGFARESVNMETLVGESKAIRARHVLFLFDSCFSGTILNARDRVRPESISDNIRHPVRQFITAGRANEPVPDRSVFKTAFLDLIDGRAVEPFRDGYITGAELGLYLKNQVPIYNEAQHPQYGKIRDPKLDKGDFVFVLPRRSTSSPQADLPPLATLSVTSTPSGATVYLNGAPIGETPLRYYEIDTGIRREKQVEIGVELTGYKSRVKSVTVTGGQNVPWDVLLEPILASSPPQTAAVLNQEKVVFKLTDGELIAKSDIESLRDEDIGPITLRNHKNEQIEVTTCREYDAALQRGYDDEPNDAKVDRILFIHRCGLLNLLQEATTPQQSFISNPRVGVADLELLPLSLFGRTVGRMGENDDNVNGELTYQTAVDTANLMVTHVSQDSLTVEEIRDPNDNFSRRQSLSEVVRADFNGDGIEDVLLFDDRLWIRTSAASMPWGGIIVLTRESRDGKFEVIFEN